MHTRLTAALALGFATMCGAPAYATCPTWHTLTNGTSADATQVMDNFNVILQCPVFTGNITAGIVYSQGSSAGFAFYDRTNTSNAWAWYSNGNTASLWYSGLGNALSVDQNGNAIFGGSSAQVLGPSSTPALQVLGNSGTGGAAGFANYVNSASGPQVLFFKSRSAAIGTKAAIGSADDVGGISANADDGSTSGGLTVGAMEFEEDGAVSAGNASGKIVFLTRSGATFAERLRITSSGNVGIGTPSPDAPLTVTGGMDVLDSDLSSISFRDDDDTQKRHGFWVTNTDTNGGMLAGITNYPGAGTSANLNGLYITPSYAGNWSQWMPTISVIGTSANLPGIVGIGTTSPSYTLHVNGSVAGTSAYNNLSDVRLKKDIRPITDGLTMVEKLRGVRFAWRTPDERTVGKTLELPTKVRQVGFVAQEVKSVLPEAVTTAAGKDAIMSIQESKVVPVLVEAVKELKSLNDRQAEDILELKHEVAELRTGLNTTALNGSVLHRVALALGWW